jgi:hypothetical protein
MSLLVFRVKVKFGIPRLSSHLHTQRKQF